MREVKSVLMIVVSSNRGLCGSFNTQVAKKIKDEITHPERLKINRFGKKKISAQGESTSGGESTNEELKIDFIVVGKKGENIVRKLEKNIIASFADAGAFAEVGDVQSIYKMIADDYLAKKYDKVVVVYTDYISTIVQKTCIRQVLPISKIDMEKQIAEMDVLAKEYGLEEPVLEYKVEPSPKEVLEFILPRLIEMQIFHAILESRASEESARMMAMRNATDAAAEMSEDLTLAYNQIRQGKITQEIAEISAGRAALE